MNPKKNRIKTILGFFSPDGMRMAVVAALFSVLTVFALLIAICPKWYETLPIYSELITGVTTFSGYNKAADMQIVKVVLWGIPVFFFGFCGVLRFLKTVVGMEQKALLVTFGGYLLWLISMINGQKSSLFFCVVLFLGIVSYCILKFGREIAWDRGERPEEKVSSVPYIGEAAFREQLISIGVGGLLAYIAFQSIGSVLFFYLNNRVEISNRFVYQIPAILACVWVIGSAVGIRKNKISMDRQLAFWQMIIPISLLPMATFRYLYEATGETFLLFYSSRYKYFMYGLAVLFAGYGIYAFLKKKKGIYVTTLIAVAMLRSFTMPEGILNIDFFHMGEMSTPFMQLQEYGKLPFFDVMPIHGLCDYYYSVIDYLFLDNTYLSMNGAMTIGNLLLAAFLSIVIYLFCERKEGALVLVYCFVPFIVNDAGIRYIFLVVSFFVLFSAKIRKSALAYVWWYVILSIVSIAWNMSIGGAGAAAFFPVVLFWYFPKALRELKELFGSKQRKKIWQFFISYGILLVTGICYIPVFLQIVSYLRENTGTTLMANGMAMIEEFASYKEYLTPSLYGGEQISFLQVFGFLIPFLCCLVMAFHKGNKQARRDGREYAVVYFVCFYIIANYAFVRFDSGLRTSVLSVIFLAVFLLGVQRWKRPEFLLLALLTVCMTGGEMDISIDTLAEKKTVESSVATTIRGEEVEDPIVYVTGDSVGMKRLGSGFIRGNTLQNLQNLKYVFEAEAGETREYLDLTNGVANYVFLDGAMVLPYTSGYNISNEKMQKSAIEQLEAHPVDLVILAPYIRFDEATISLRSPMLYEYLYEAGYEPYVYENVIYMKKSGSALFPESNGFTDFASLCHKEALQMLPAVWGTSEAVDSLNEVKIETEAVPGERGVTWNLTEKVNGESIDFVRITIPEQQTDGESKEAAQENAGASQHELCFIFGEEEYEFTFYDEGNDFLIPVYSSPFWKNLSEVDSFTIQVEDGDETSLYGLKNATVSFWNF